MSHILVVDDELSIRATLSEFLKVAGHGVTTADDAAGALGALRENSIDVVLSDIVLPRMDGLDLLRVVRKASPDTKVILMTGRPDVDSAVDAHRQGAFDYLCKPVTKDALLRAVDSACRFAAIERETERLAEENRHYQENLEGLVAERTRELAHAEDELYHARKMEAVGQLAGGVAHDFNNLLTGIRGCAEFILGAAEPRSSMRSDAEEILAICMMATDLTRQLLIFSRHDETTLHPLCVSDVVSGLRKILRRLIPEDIELECQLTGEEGIVNADPGQVEQLVTNLAVNARDAMPAGGRLVLATRSAALDDAACRHLLEKPDCAAEHYMALSVTDTGCGISEDVQPRIFEPFFTTKERGRGTGIGLATVYGIVKRHGGCIGLESTVGVGTTFHVYLPCMAAGSETPVPVRTPDDAVSPGTETVLLVEDDDMVRRTAARMLRESGYAVLAAGSGNEALRVVETPSALPDVLVTDVVMPGMSGKALADVLRQRHPDLGVVFVSGYAGEWTTRPGPRPDEGLVLGKPFTKAQITREVRNALSD